MRFGRKSETSRGKQARARLRSHDQKLLKLSSDATLPRLNQLRFLFRFLSKKEYRVFLVGLALVLIGVVIGGYQFVKTHRVSAPDVGGEYQEVIVGTPRLVNPIYSSANEVDQDLSRLLYSGLLRYDKNGLLIPDLAESFTVNTSTTQFTVTLRENLTWHDETLITADDVLFTIERIQDPTVGSPMRLSFQGVTVTKSDDRTIVFDLENAFAPFAHTLTVGILPKHAWLDVLPSAMKLADANIRPVVGSGPYQFVELQKNRNGIIISYALEHFQNFHRGEPFVESIRLHFAPDTLSAIDMFANKRVDGIHFVPKADRETIAKRDTNIYTIALPQYTGLFFNQKRNEALETLTVRQALAHAIDREQLISSTLGATAQAIVSPLLPGSIGYQDDAPFYEFSPTTSTALLDGAKWKTIDRETYIALRTEQLVTEWEEQQPVEDVNKDELSEEELAEFNEQKKQKRAELEGLAREQIETQIPPSQDVFRKNGDDQILGVTITTVHNSETIAVAELIQSYWQAIGIDVQIQTVDPQLIQSEVLKDRNYEVLLFGEVLSADPDLYPFWHSSQIDDPGLNLSLFINRKADTLLEEARETTNQDTRTENYQAFEQILHAELPAIFLYNPKYVYAQRKKIQNFDVSRLYTPADRFNEIETWFIETKGEWQ